MDNASSAESSFYDPPEQYDEKKTRKLHKNIETNFEDLKSMLMSVQENLLRLHSDFVVTVKLIEKLKTHEEQQKKEDQDESDVNATATNENGDMRVVEVKLVLLVLLMNVFIHRSSADIITSTDKDFNTYLAPEWQSYVMDIITKGFTNLTLNLDKVLEERKSCKDENILFSPASITKSLGMVMLISKDQIHRDLAKILGLDSGLYINHYSEVVHRMLSLSIEDYEKKHKADPTYPRCTLSSTIFYKVDSIQNRQKSLLNAGIYVGDNTEIYSSYDNGVRKALNSWIHNHTDGGISEALTESIDHYNLPAVVASASNFDGEWHREFPHTSSKSFNPEPNESVEVEMMMKLGRISYYESESLGLRVAGIPFKEQEVVMYILLPNANGTSGLRSMKEKLDASVIEDLIANTTEEVAMIFIPKLNLTSRIQLRDSLSALGLKSLFEETTGSSENSNTNDRSNFSETEREYVNYILQENDITQGTDHDRENFKNIPANEFIHAVKMTLDAKGSESGPLRGREDIKAFFVDKPFLFFIRYKPTKSILLWGSIYKP
ncbi:hypothetical protein QAD02_001007 [Eretmocerus hayati]|uniref:Uncharacterized protein n=1 Tax=Eretmocerus hayati TaxID=131215 RepID=A0ACC2NFP8_9HYME|nr:hypothetical protein QAD02_001007 [Eretmocerus hayati]